MPPNTNPFPHLTFEVVHSGRARLHGGGEKSAETLENEKNRKSHAEKLKSSFERAGRRWVERSRQRAEAHLPDLPPGIPLTLKVDDEADIEFLRSAFGFEIVAEDRDGYILVATENLDPRKLESTISKFLEEKLGGGSAAKLHEFLDAESMDVRLKRVLDNQLYQDWGNVEDTKTYIVDVSISNTGGIDIPDFGPQGDDETDEHLSARLERYRERNRETLIKWDEIQMEREAHIQKYIQEGAGEILRITHGPGEGFFNLPDSFTVRVLISGQIIRDLAMNHPHLIAIELPEDVEQPSDHTEPYGEDPPPLLQAPEPGAPGVCVIDSGIQENHLYLKAAVLASESRCFIPGEDPANTADYVHPHGHGTRVAGAVLYPREIPKGKTVEPPCWLLNARVLDKDNNIPKTLMPALYVERIVKHFTSPDRECPAKIFNHSINSRVPGRGVHMSTWAAAIDKMSHEHDILFIQSAGNIAPGDIAHYWKNGHDYPKYQNLPQCLIRNPAHSLSAITVSSIAATTFKSGSRASIARESWPSAFSPAGPGIWGSIKPDVVEVGGDFVKEDETGIRVFASSQVATELVRSTLHGPGATAKDGVGTSFAAPRVSHIAAQLARELPEESCLLYRALIASSARWPVWTEKAKDPLGVLKRIGYGIPDLERATRNSDYRVTLVSSGRPEIAARDAHIFHIVVPDEVRTAGKDAWIRIDITLAYTARPRRTRRNLRGYLATTVSWDVSKTDETFASFKHRMLHDGDTTQCDGQDIFDWHLRENKDWGKFKGISRQNSTLQKDWCFIRSNRLPPDFCIAVIGHPGWNPSPDEKAKYALAVSFDAVNQDLKIYEPIRTSIETRVDTISIREQVRVEAVTPPE